jgi:2-octaprenylphenol hydroxylase|tara:strand:+ start:448 stop:1668 length:1221 start_codon:yes stop_codon:yes gene_type:complete
MSAQAVVYDIVIVGAGIVGSALACALAKSSFNIAIIEAQERVIDRNEQATSVDGFDVRVSAITIASQQLLEDIGAWEIIAENRLSPYRHMHVWDAEGTGSIDFDADDINQLALGHIVENKVTADALTQCMNRQTNLHRIVPAILEEIEPLQNGAYLLTLGDGRQLQTSLLVAADGANSKVRALEHIAMREWDYNHHAIVATVKTELSHGHTARQRFLPEGPLAFLPLSSAQDDTHYCSIVWSAIPSYAENLMSLTDDEFTEALAAAFEYQLGSISAVSRRFSFPLRQRHVVDYIKPGLALVGDAAHTIHPLAGQGVNLGLMDIKTLSEELLRSQQRGLNPGSIAVLERYQRRRKGANLAMMAGMDGLKRLFSETTLPVRWARNSGLRWLDKSKMLKRQIMKRAMGL